MHVLSLSIVLLIFLSHDQNVQCSILDFMSDQWRDFKQSFVNIYAFANNIVRADAKHKRNLQNNQLRKISSFLQLTQNSKPEKNLGCAKTAHTHSTAQLAATHGRIIETHITYTEDGYLLTLHRVCSSKTHNHSESRATQRTVLLHHGLLGSSADWIQLGSKKSLPYILSDAGHDVWLANSRGNFYSRTHVSMTPISNEYWNFSWEEIGERDLSAVLDYIRLKKNSTEPIDYIGHSMGATALLVLLSVKPKYNQYLRMAFLLAPLAYMEHTRGPLQTLAKVNQVELAEFLGFRDFMPTGIASLSSTSNICEDLEIYCRNPLFFLSGSPIQEGTRTKEFTDRLQEYIPAGGSVKTIMHYIELVKNKKFHRRGRPDWSFKTKHITTPIVIFSSNDDLLSTTPDNIVLFLSISNPVGHILINGQNLSHTEFVWGYNADVVLYSKIIDFIDAGPEANEINNKIKFEK